MRSNIPQNTQSWYLEIYKDILENAEFIIFCKIKVDGINKKILCITSPSGPTFQLRGTTRNKASRNLLPKPAYCIRSWPLSELCLNMPCTHVKNNRMKQRLIKNISKEASSHLLLPLCTAAKQKIAFMTLHLFLKEKLQVCLISLSCES